jgi:hypothetical protein
LIKELLFPF